MRYCATCEIEYPAAKKCRHACRRPVQDIFVEEIQRVCPSCLATVTAGKRFCRNCGSPLMTNRELHAGAGIPAMIGRIVESKRDVLAVTADEQTESART